jgi:uridine kinase
VGDASVELLPRLAAAITARRADSRVLLVGIDGRGGSGKSTLARALRDVIDGSVVVEFDDFYRPTRTRLSPGDPDVGGNFDWRRLRDQVLTPLGAGRGARYQRYDWIADSPAEWHTVSARGVVLVDGNYSTREELRRCYGLRIWVHAPHAVRLARGIARGGEDTRERWLEEWMPEEERYLVGTPWRHADVIVDTSRGVGEVIDVATTSPAALDQAMRT